MDQNDDYLAFYDNPKIGGSIFSIINKKGEKVKFKLNKAQRDYHEKTLKSPKRKRVVLKSRQHGFTTDACSKLEAKVMTRAGYSAFIIAHDLPSVNKIFQEKIKYPFETLPQSLKSLYIKKTDNANEIRFANEECFNSYIRVGTSARSSTVQDLHVTEAGIIGSDQAKWTELVTGSFNAAQDITLEGTADGVNLFYDFIQEIRTDPYTDWDFFFYNWMWSEDYRIKAPENDQSWIQDYSRIANLYGLNPDPVKNFGIDYDQFFWYYQTAKIQKERMVQEYPFTIDEAFLLAGDTVFEFRILEELARNVRPKEVINGVEYYVKPVPGRRYVIGVDPATGEGADSTSIDVMDFLTAEQVAHISGKLNPMQTALIATRLGFEYNTALIGCEINGMGIATQNEIQKLYPAECIYMRLQTDPTNLKFKKTVKYGWETTGITKPIMIEEIRVALTEGAKINSIETINQFKTFVRKNGKMEAETGKHDDCVMSYAIAFQLRKNIRTDY